MGFVTSSLQSGLSALWAGVFETGLEVTNYSISYRLTLFLSSEYLDFTHVKSTEIHSLGKSFIKLPIKMENLKSSCPCSFRVRFSVYLLVVRWECRLPIARQGERPHLRVTDVRRADSRPPKATSWPSHAPPQTADGRTREREREIERERERERGRRRAKRGGCERAYKR